MKKYLHLVLLLFTFAGFANAQPASTAKWFGYILPSNPTEYKYITFTMQDLGSVSVASDVLPAVTTATFADGYVWSVNNDNGYNICRSSFDATNNLIGAPEVMVANVPYINDMAYNPADGLIYIITEEHLKSFNPATPNNIQDHGARVLSVTMRLGNAQGLLELFLWPPRLLNLAMSQVGTALYFSILAILSLPYPTDAPKLTKTRIGMTRWG